MQGHCGLSFFLFFPLCNQTLESLNVISRTSCTALVKAVTLSLTFMTMFQKLLSIQEMMEWPKQDTERARKAEKLRRGMMLKTGVFSIISSYWLQYRKGRLVDSVPGWGYIPYVLCSHYCWSVLWLNIFFFWPWFLRVSPFLFLVWKLYIVTF